MSMPDGFRLLEGEELAAAERAYSDVVPALVADEDHGRYEYTRIVYERGGLADADPEHFRAITAGAVAVGDETALICDFTAPETGERVAEMEFSALEVNLAGLAAYLETEPFRRTSGKAGWEIAETRDWPVAAQQIVDPHFVDEWTVLSPGKWCWMDQIATESCLLTCDRVFLEGYRGARPDVINDPIRFLHGDGYEMVSEITVERVPAPGWRGRIGLKSTVAHAKPVFSSSAREYLEPMYGEDGARRIFEIYMATLAVVPERSDYRTWDEKEAAIDSAIASEPDFQAELKVLWSGV